ncbi:hypothetical protein FOA52_006472 [Chlamydomonas sp. UWO 241]|nr:hypothetical protein FOA52_006472 [Chlamydomonas sp. UWO 241]
MPHATLWCLSASDREALKFAQEEFQGLPPLLLAELAAGALIATTGGFLLSGTLRKITATRQSRASDVGSMRPDFLSFGLRSRALAFALAPQL